MRLDAKKCAWHQMAYPDIGFFAVHVKTIATPISLQLQPRALWKPAWRAQRGSRMRFL
jgi:hypothetical protein